MYDAIVVGARCAGSPTAMLLARRGYRVLLVDRAAFPSDTMSTHFIQRPGMARLKRWGLLEAVGATNCPAIEQLTLSFGDMKLVPPRPPAAPDAPDFAYCPRRTVLDKILVDAAVAAGAELRERFPVREIVFEGDRVVGIRGGSTAAPVEERARIVIGADGLHSTVARGAGAPEYDAQPSFTFGYYTYWSGLPGDGAELYFLEGAGILVFPTNDGLTCIGVGGPNDQFHQFRSDIDRHYRQYLELVPSLAERMRDARREARYIGTAEQRNFFRRPHGPGWALVGDAGYHRDFITGLGISDAFRDAEYLTDAIDDGLSGRRPLEEALADYERRRNEAARPLYEFTCKLASGQVPSPEMWMQFGLALSKY